MELPYDVKNFEHRQDTQSCIFPCHVQSSHIISEMREIYKDFLFPMPWVKKPIYVHSVEGRGKEEYSRFLQSNIRNKIFWKSWDLQTSMKRVTNRIERIQKSQDFIKDG